MSPPSSPHLNRNLAVAVGTPVTRRPPHRSRRAVFPHRALQPGTSSPPTGRFASMVRHSYGTGCLCELRQTVGPLTHFGACTLLRATMNQSDSRCTSRHSLSLRLPSCLALVVSAAGMRRASFVPCVSFDARHALRPRQALLALTLPGDLVLDADIKTPSPLAFDSFEAELLKPDAPPACGSRLPVSTLLDGRSSRKPSDRPSAKQPSGLGGWLDLSIFCFRSNSSGSTARLRGLSPPVAHSFTKRTLIVILS
jgi:hypothetical protein